MQWRKKWRQLFVAASSVALVGFLGSGCRRTTPVAEISTGPERVGADSPIEVAERSWPWWGGPGGDRVAGDQQVPFDWSDPAVIRWITSVPGKGHSSPCVWEDQVFLTTADQGASTLELVCLDRDDGHQRWNRVVHSGSFMKKHSKNSYASATPACDGDRVYTAFIHDGGLWVTAVDRQGEVVWQEEAGPFVSEHGYGSSPVLYRSLVIVAGDNLRSSFVAALDRETGEIVWRTARKTSGRHGSYATPIVGHVADQDQLLITGTNLLVSYDPATGTELWRCRGPAEVTAASVAFGGELVFASGGYPEKTLMAVRADGTGDVTESHVVWSTGRGVAYVPSPLLHDGRLYVVADGGTLTCFDAQTGRQLSRTRLDGDFSASPVWVAAHLIIPNEAGTVYVVRADGNPEIVAENRLGNAGFATPAICGNQIFLRTDEQLYCIEGPAVRQ